MVIYDNLNRDSGDDGEGRPQRGCELVGSLINCSLNWKGAGAYMHIRYETATPSEITRIV